MCANQTEEYVQKNMSRRTDCSGLVISFLYILYIKNMAYIWILLFLEEQIFTSTQFMLP